MRIRNRERLARKLAAIPKAAKEEIRKALAESASEIVDLQRRAAPVEDGDLRDSIDWHYGDAKRIAYSQGFGGTHELGVRISAGNTFVRYAHLVEFGTAPHPQGGKFAGSMHPGTPAKPFFYPMYRLGKKRAKSRITRGVNRAAKKVAAGR